MPCGQYRYGKCRTNNTRGLLSRPILGRLAYLNKVQSKPAPTRNYGSEDARSRAIRRRALGKYKGSGSSRDGKRSLFIYGPMFGLKQNKCGPNRDGIGPIYRHANHGDSSDVTYFKRVAAGPFIQQTQCMWNSNGNFDNVPTGCCGKERGLICVFETFDEA